MNPLAWFRLAHQRSFWLVALRTRWTGKSLTRLVDKDRTHLCIEGYPRSANSFCTRLFWLANPEEREHVAHHTHATGSIARALRFKIPVILLIRNPVDAIVSACMKAGTKDLDFRVRYYIEFHEWLVPRKGQVVVADFGLATTDFNEVIDRVNRKYGVTFNKVADLEETQEQLLAYLRGPEFREKKRQRRGREGWMPVSDPRPREAAKKDELRSLVLQHERIGVALALYQEVTS